MGSEQRREGGKEEVGGCEGARVRKLYIWPADQLLEWCSAARLHTAETGVSRVALVLSVVHSTGLLGVVHSLRQDPGGWVFRGHSRSAHAVQGFVWRQLCRPQFWPLRKKYIWH